MGLFNLFKKKKYSPEKHLNIQERENQSQRYLDIEQYLSKKVKTKTEGNKKINLRTGYPLAKSSAINKSIADAKALLSYPEDDYKEDAKYDKPGAKTTVSSYLLSIYLPYYFAGIAAYKNGDWDIAEKWWLSVLDIHCITPAQKLEIMYRKQKRYKDIAKMYEKAYAYSKYYLKVSGQDFTEELKELKNTAEEDALKHSTVDNSIGIIDYPSRINKSLIKVLQSISYQSSTTD